MTVVCDCGTVATMRSNAVTRGQANSCKVCAKLRKARESSARSKHPLYKLWAAIKQRCGNKNLKSYRYYGAKGVGMYFGWLNDFESFKRYVESELPQKKPGDSLDRVDPSVGYVPGNLRWANRRVQASNKRLAARFNYNGQEIAVGEFADMVGVPSFWWSSALSYGVPLSTAADMIQKYIAANGLPKRFSWLKIFGLPRAENTPWGFKEPKAPTKARLLTDAERDELRALFS